MMFNCEEMDAYLLEKEEHIWESKKRRHQILVL